MSGRYVTAVRRLASTMARAVALDLGTSPPAAGKYVLYYAANCPFAHRVRFILAVGYLLAALRQRSDVAGARDDRAVRRVTHI